MTAIPALAFAASLATAADLEAAQAAFSRQEYARAEELALKAAEPPTAGAAFYLLGLARFRAGRPAEALDALEQAGRAPDAPEATQWHYNKGACLLELERFHDAEAEFLEAAKGPALAAVALVNAGHAAIDGGAPQRAAGYATRAKAAASGSAAGLVADLEARLAGAGNDRATAEYRSGLVAYDAGRFAEARDRFLKAAELDPADGRSRIMSGAAALRLGRRVEARTDLETALRLRLDANDASTARDYLDSLSRGLPEKGKGWAGTGRLAAGYDSDALQTGLFDPSEFRGTASTTTPSAMTTASVSLAFRRRTGEHTYAELTYALDQLAYLSSGASDRSLQQHGLGGALEIALRPDLRVGGSLAGQLAFTGLSAFRGLQAAAGAGAWAAFDEGDQATTRLDLEASRKGALKPEFSYLTGQRLDATLSQELRFDALSVDFGYRFRFEDIGTSTSAPPRPPPRFVCPDGCSAESVVPFGYAGNTLWLSARAPLGTRAALDLSGGFEWRRYLDDQGLQLTFADGSSRLVDRRRREDQRWFASAATSVRLTPRLALSLRYDLLLSRSNVASGAPEGGVCGPPDFQCHALDNEHRSYDKHVFTLGIAFAW